MKIASIQSGGATIVGLVNEHAEELLLPKPQADYNNALDLRRVSAKLQPIVVSGSFSDGIVLD